MFFKNTDGRYKQFRFQPVQILALGVAGIIFIGALLLMLPVSSNKGEYTHFLDALFTATSATCVTGLAVLDTGTYWSLFGQIVILVLIQIGGIGFMAFSTLAAIILGKRVGLKERLIVRETYNVFDIQGLVKLVIYIFSITLIIEVSGAVVLITQFIQEYPLQRSIYYGVFHSISSFCNAGFDLFGDFTGYVGYVTNSVVTIVIGILISLGGLGFFVLTEISNYKKGKRFSLHTKVVITMTIFLTITGAVLFFIFEYNNLKTIGDLPAFKKVTASIFASITPRSGGISTIPKPEMTYTSQFLTILLMFIGASPGSTGGGIKTTTFMILLVTILSVIRGREEVELFKKRINQRIVYRAISITFIAFIAVFFITIVLSITEEGTFLEILYEATSAFGNVGLSLGITPNLTPIGKTLILIAMYVGRVGPLTLLFSFAYKQRISKTSIKYPEDKIIVG